MGKPKYLPTGKKLKRLKRKGAEIANELLSQSDGVLEPGSFIACCPTQLGITFSDEELLRALMFHGISDRGTDSLDLAARYVWDAVHYGFRKTLNWPSKISDLPEYQLVLEEDPFDPGVFIETWSEKKPETHFTATLAYLLELQHPFAGQVAGHWVHTHQVINNRFGGSLLGMLNSGTTRQVYKLLRQECLGTGPKTTPLIMGRAKSCGLAPHIDMQEIGPAVDRHLMALTVSCELLPDVRGLVNADAVINACRWFWRETCQDFDIPVHEYQCAAWKKGRNDCRFANCTQCDLWKKNNGVCKGRLSMAPYNGDGRKLDSNWILPPSHGQLSLNLGIEHEASPPSGPHEVLLRTFLGKTQPSLPLFPP